jgi:hypothetical protein
VRGLSSPRPTHVVGCTYHRVKRRQTTRFELCQMSAYQSGESAPKPYTDPTPLPDSVPKVAELGTTSAPLKSAAFFIGAFCRQYNGTSCCLFLVGFLEGTELNVGW